VGVGTLTVKQVGLRRNGTRGQNERGSWVALQKKVRGPAEGIWGGRGTFRDGRGGNRLGFNEEPDSQRCEPISLLDIGQKILANCRIKNWGKMQGSNYTFLLVIHQT